MTSFAIPASPAPSSLSKPDLLAAAQAGRLDGAVMADLARFAAGPLARTAEDAELLSSYAQAAWIADQRAPAATRARDAAARLVALLPNLRAGYKILGLAHLTRGEPREAAAAFAAGAQVEGDEALDNFRALATQLARGRTSAAFALDGASYDMPLSCHNAAAIEAGAFHAVGQLTEIDELRTIARLAASRPVRRIVEIGVLVGNHTAFFLRTFRPDHLVLADADPANHALITRTVATHAARPPPVVELVAAFIGRGGGETTFAGTRVPHRRLSDVAPGPIDLIKIDVDGAEAVLLEHGGEPIERYRPLVMIETTAATDGAVRGWFAARGFPPPLTFDRGGYRNLILDRVATP